MLVAPEHFNKIVVLTAHEQPVTIGTDYEIARVFGGQRLVVNAGKDAGLVVDAKDRNIVRLKPVGSIYKAAIG